MARGIGGNYGIDQGANPSRAMFNSQQPAGTPPLNNAPMSPRVGTGRVATVPSAGIGDTPSQAVRAAATPTYGVASLGAVTNSNRGSVAASTAV